jgi:localization factor PodJL
MFVPLEEHERTSPSLATDADKAKTREDYLAAARRAALAQAAAEKSQRRDSAMPPILGLRGPGRIVLWGAAGAIAAALSGGLWFLKAQSSDNETALSPAPLGPSAAEALPLPLNPPFDDEIAASANESEESLLREGSAADRLNRQGAPTIAGPIAPRNDTLERAAAAGDPIAQYDLALQRLSASRTREAVNLLRSAAEKNLAMAQYRLAKLYERGEGIGRNLDQARLWTERAAAGGNRRAMHDLGVFYAQGTGAQADEQAASQWFRRAALLGVTDSQYNLAVLLQQGHGVEANSTEALFWFLVAARQGDADARANAQAIEASLSPSEAENARYRAEAFRPHQANARANGEFGARAWTRSAEHP